MNLFRSLLDLFFPRLCASCDCRLHEEEQFVCINCINRIDTPRSHLREVELQFAGRVAVERLYVPFSYSRHSIIQRIVHRFKYYNDPILAHYMGQQLASRLIAEEEPLSIDAVIPVPLHPQKFKKRGYNQSQLLAEGISSVLHIPVYDHVLLRMVSNPTQTTLQKRARWANVESIFNVQSVQLIEGKSILLIDDVFTTGSTLESCARTLLTVPNVKIYVATLAIV